MVRILLVLLFFINNAFAAIQVKVDKTQMSIIDSLSVSIRADNFANKTFDVGVLNADFNIINQSSASSFNFINGQISSVIDLKLTLQPKRIGELIIPAFKAGNQVSKPIVIKVNNANEANFEDNIIFIKSQLNNANPMVQQQIIYTVSLYSQVNFKDTGLNFMPQIADAKVKKIADSNFQQVNFKGKRLWKKDFNFAIYPQKIGKLSIPSIKQEIFINNPNPNKILLFAKAINLTVAPAHSSYPAGEYWLPATNVELSEKPFDTGQKIIAGEPFVRQIVVKVSAQSANQVPLIKLANNSLLEQYADSNSNTEKLTHNNIVSISKQNILLIANNSGEQILPEIKLTWFDTDDNKTKIARLRATKIQIAPPLATPKTLVLPKLEDKNIDPNIAQTKPIIIQPTYWKSIAFLSFSLWLLTLLICWFYRQSKPKKPVQNKKTTDISQLKMIKEYANKNDAKATKQALDAWIFTCYGILDTNNFAQQMGDEFASEVLILQQNLYQSNKQWDGQKFYQVFSTTIKNNAPIKNQQPFSNLYPDTV